MFYGWLIFEIFIEFFYYKKRLKNKGKILSSFVKIDLDSFFFKYALYIIS